jgi:type 1 glutamine amidotransferase
MKVLLLCGDYWHPHEVPIEGVKPLEEKGFSFDVVTDAEDFDPAMLGGYPAILLAKSGEITNSDKDSWKTEGIQQAFADYVESGGGLLAVHNATVGGERTQTLDRLLGCRFAYHPADCPVTVQAVKPHPITQGAGVFTETDEHYRLDILSDDIDIFMASYSPAQGEVEMYGENPYHNSPAWICAAGYTRRHGKGRVCVLTPGHLLPVWHNAEYQKVLENALKWCASKE